MNCSIIYLLIYYQPYTMSMYNAVCFFFVPCTNGIPLWIYILYIQNSWIFHCWVGFFNTTPCQTKSTHKTAGTWTFRELCFQPFNRCGGLFRAQPLEELLLLQPPCLMSPQCRTHPSTAINSWCISPNCVQTRSCNPACLVFHKGFWSNHINCCATSHIADYQMTIKDVTRSRWLQTFFPAPTCSTASTA